MSFDVSMSSSYDATPLTRLDQTKPNLILSNLLMGFDLEKQASTDQGVTNIAGFEFLEPPENNGVSGKVFVLV